MSQPKPTSPTAPTKRSPRILAGTATLQPDGNRAAMMQSYEAAIHLMQEGKYDMAHAAFDKMLLSSPVELADRIRMYISACLSQMESGATTFSSSEEQYDYAVSLLNVGQYADAREHFVQILDANPSADYAFYGLAVLASMTGDSHQCLEHLTNAIKYNPRNRIQARSDSDFQDMADDPRFTELLYPEV
jgi:tetratricopeptide (TPR) repeat protein